MVRPGRDRLSGWVEVDETYLGSREEDASGRGVQHKALIVVAAQADGKGIGRIRMRRPSAGPLERSAPDGESSHHTERKFLVCLPV